ncbi:unnamed protein product [Symbiodinium sp. CCMP2592]|nr:unnamed protein product [Symbiodinium sp. CCMP2592]
MSSWFVAIRQSQWDALWMDLEFMELVDVKIQGPVMTASPQQAVFATRTDCVRVFFLVIGREPEALFGLGVQSFELRDQDGLNLRFLYEVDLLAIFLRSEEALFSEGRRLKLNISQAHDRAVTMAGHVSKELPKHFVLLHITIKTTAALTAFPESKSGRILLGALHFGVDDRNGPANLRGHFGLLSPNWDVCIRTHELACGVSPVCYALNGSLGEVTHWRFIVVMETPPDVTAVAKTPTVSEVPHGDPATWMAQYVHKNTLDNKKIPVTHSLILFTSATDAVLVHNLYKKAMLVTHLVELTVPANVLRDNEEFSVRWVSGSDALCTYWLLTTKSPTDNLVANVSKAYTWLCGQSKAFMLSRGNLEVTADGSSRAFNERSKRAKSLQSQLRDIKAELDGLSYPDPETASGSSDSTA